MVISKGVDVSIAIMAAALTKPLLQVQTGLKDALVKHMIMAAAQTGFLWLKVQTLKGANLATVRTVAVRMASLQCQGVGMNVAVRHRRLAVVWMVQHLHQHPILQVIC